jgi:hypothetical protein
MERIKKKAKDWRPIPGLKGYEASNCGDVRCYIKGINPVTRECKDGKIRKFFTGVEQLEKSYELDWKVNKKTNEVTVTVLVNNRMSVRPLNNLIASAFGIEKPVEYASKLVHKNYDFFDFRALNLVWKRKKKKRQAGPTKQKIDAVIARNIRILLKMGYWAKAISRQFQISESLVSQIKKGTRWPNAGGPLDDGKEADMTIDKWTVENAEKIKHTMMIEFGMISPDQLVMPEIVANAPLDQPKDNETANQTTKKAVSAPVVKKEPEKQIPTDERPLEERIALINEKLGYAGVNRDDFVRYSSECGRDPNHYGTAIMTINEMRNAGLYKKEELFDIPDEDFN